MHITRIVFIALRVAFLFVQKVLFNSRDLGLSFFPWNLPSVFTVVLLSFPEWDFICLCLAGIQRCRTCLKLLRCAAGCFHWTAGEPLEIPPKKHKALLMPLTSFFLTLTLLFPNPLLFCSLSFSPLKSTFPVFGAYWLRGRPCSGWKAICPVRNLMMACQEAHTGSGGAHSFLSAAAKAAAVVFGLQAKDREVALWAAQCAAAEWLILLLQEDTFQQYVKPQINPKLSDFCINLTGITQVICTFVSSGRNREKRDVVLMFSDW